MQTINKAHQQIIEKYTEAYNNFGVDGMMQHMDEQVKFEHITDGKTTLALTGKAAFREQAEKAKSYFKERHQHIAGISEEGNQLTIDINYTAILALDLPNGLKAGDTLSLRGKSVITFNENKIIKLVDIS